MSITYCNRLKAHIVVINRMGRKSMLAVNTNRLQALSDALSRITWKKYEN